MSSVLGAVAWIGVIAHSRTSRHRWLRDFDFDAMIVIFWIGRCWFEGNLIAVLRIGNGLAQH